jgi:acetate---CoA ligase (ADP-forming)
MTDTIVAMNTRDASDAVVHHRRPETLTPLFRPRSIAVIGASRDSIGGRVLVSLLRGGFEGPVDPVHPREHAVASVRAYPSVLDVPDEVDLAVIAVPARVVPDVVEQCAQKGVRALVVLSAGFAETGAEGRALQDRVLRIVRDHEMRMVGPNCLGVVNTDPEVRLNAIFGRPLAARGRVAMSSQSGAMGLAIIDYADELGLGVSHFVSVGNKADISGNDLLEYWEHDPATNVIVLYLESFGNPRRFSRIARRVARQKPILAVKSGRGVAGSRAARSHTAALAGSDMATDALFHQSGVIRLDTLEELFDVAALLTNQPLPAGNRVAIITNAGGPAILCADACEANGLQLPTLSAATVEVLRGALPSAASLGNPVDMIASASPDQYELVARQVLLDPEIDALIAMNISVGEAGTEAFAAAVRKGAESALTASGVAKPVLSCLMAAGKPSLALRAPDGTSGLGTIPSYRFPEAPARALAHAVRYKHWLDRPMSSPRPLDGVDLSRARATVDASRARGAEWLSPDEAQTLMEATGIRKARQRTVSDARQAAEAAVEIGFPVGVKVVSREVLHKSDVGGVALDLQSADEVRAACEAMHASLGARIEGFLVQEQARQGREVLVGVVADPVFGPLVGFGLGGTVAEALHDTVFRLTPLTEFDAAEMVRSIRGHALLGAFLGQPPADLAALEELLLRVSWLADNVEISEMDLNPVVVYPEGEGTIALDVRVAVRAAHEA